MKKDYFKTDLTGYSLATFNKGTRLMCFKGAKIVTDFYTIPRGLIEQAARYLGISLYGEMSYFTGKIIYKAGIINNENGGITGLYTTESRADFNRWILTQNKQGE